MSFCVAKTDPAPFFFDYEGMLLPVVHVFVATIPYNPVYASHHA